MKKTLKDIQVEYDDPILILCDNTNAISISKSPVMHSKMNHISCLVKVYCNFIVNLDRSL
jgi:hypothetical protein